MGINTFYLLMFFIFAGFYCVHMWGVRQLGNAIEYYHPLVKMFALTLTMQFLSIIFYMLHWGIYSSNGIGVQALLQAGEVVDAVTRCLFMLILILMAKGWTISGEELTGKKIIVGTVFVFLVVHSCILLWKFALEDPAAVSLSKSLEVILWIELIVWFLFAGYFSFTVFSMWRREENPVKRALYLRMGIIYSIWFFGYPALTFVDLAETSSVARDWSTVRRASGRARAPP